MARDQFLLFFVLGTAEVSPSTHVERLFGWQPSEGFIKENLVERGVLQCAFGNSRAASVDFVHDVGQSVELS